MAGFYQAFTSARLTEPDPASLLAQLRVSDATAGVQHEVGTPKYTIKKNSAWLAGQISSVQTVIDTTPAMTPQLTAQAQIDNWSIMEKAFALALIDQLNIIRAALPVPKPDISPAQALAAIRAKAATL